MKHGDKAKSAKAKASGKEKSTKNGQKAGAKSSKAGQGAKKSAAKAQAPAQKANAKGGGPKAGAKAQAPAKAAPAKAARGNGAVRPNGGGGSVFTNPAVASAFKRAVKKFPNAFRKLTD